jgi:hypothetical protein
MALRLDSPFTHLDTTKMKEDNKVTSKDIFTEAFNTYVVDGNDKETELAFLLMTFCLLKCQDFHKYDECELHKRHGLLPLELVQKMKDHYGETDWVPSVLERYKIRPNISFGKRGNTDIFDVLEGPFSAGIDGENKRQLNCQVAYSLMTMMYNILIEEAESEKASHQQAINDGLEYKARFPGLIAPQNYHAYMITFVGLHMSQLKKRYDKIVQVEEDEEDIEPSPKRVKREVA